MGLDGSSLPPDAPRPNEPRMISTEQYKRTVDFTGIWHDEARNRTFIRGMDDDSGLDAFVDWNKGWGGLEEFKQLGLGPSHFGFVVREEQGLGTAKRKSQVLIADYRPMPSTISEDEARRIFTEGGFKRLPTNPVELATELNAIRDATVRLIGEKIKNAQVVTVADTERLATVRDRLAALGQPKQERPKTEFSHVDPRLREAFVAALEMGKLNDADLFGYTREAKSDVINNKNKIVAALSSRDEVQYEQIRKNPEELKRFEREFGVATDFNREYVEKRFKRLAEEIRQGRQSTTGSNIHGEIEAFVRPLAVSSSRLSAMSDAELFGFQSYRKLPTPAQLRRNAEYLLRVLSNVDKATYDRLQLKPDQLREMTEALMETTGKYISHRYRQFLSQLVAPPAPGK